MNILIVDFGRIPAFKYGGTERVIWSLGKELTDIIHFNIQPWKYWSQETISIPYIVTMHGNMNDFRELDIKPNSLKPRLRELLRFFLDFLLLLLLFFYIF